MIKDSTKDLDKKIMIENTWSHAKCEEMIQEMGYGNLTITFRIHDKRVTDILAQIFRRHRKGGDKEDK